MNFSKVIQFMNQQLEALKNIEDLLDYDEKQVPAAHTVKPEEIENLKNYVATMKQAAETAKGLADYYTKIDEAEKKTKAKEPEKTKEPEKAKETEDKLEDKIKHKGGGNYELPNGETIKGKKAALEALAKLESGETEPPEDPPAASPEPGPNGEQSEQAAAESKAAEHETNPALQVPVAAPEQVTEPVTEPATEPATEPPATEAPATDISALLAALTIDNLQG